MDIDKAKAEVEKHIGELRNTLLSRAQHYRQQITSNQFETLQKIRNTEEILKRSKGQYDKLHAELDTFVKDSSIHDLVANEGELLP